MVLFEKHFQTRDMLHSHMFEIRLQANVEFKIGYHNHLCPLVIEIGLGLITFCYTWFNYKSQQ